MLETIGSRDIPIPQHIDIFHLKNEMEASDKTALECVMEVDEERMRLEAEAAELTKLGDEGSDRYGFVAKSNCFVRCLPNHPTKIYPCSKIERPDVKPWFVGVCVVFTGKRFCIIIILSPHFYIGISLVMEHNASQGTFKGTLYTNE